MTSRPVAMKFSVLQLAMVLLSSIVLGESAFAQRDVASDTPAREKSTRIDWAAVPPPEKQTVTELLTSTDWPLRVFALLRLERFTGPEVETLVRGRLEDEAWQVRCFALRQAVQMECAVTAEELEGETVPFVVREALRAGVPLDEKFVLKGGKILLRTRNVDQLLLGMEIAAASDCKPLREDATKRFVRFIKNMDDSIRTRVSRRLAVVAGLPRQPLSVRQWRTWHDANRKNISIAPPVSETGVTPEPPSSIATMDHETFSRLIDYLSFLRQRSLEVVIVMDFTTSMTMMINQARAGVDALILFLNDISRTMQLGFVAYRDHDNPPVFERHTFTQNVDSVRDFLFNMQITGGTTFPEAVLDALTAGGDMEWTKGAAQQIILVGDAPPHPQNVDPVLKLVESYSEQDIVVHAVHVPMARGQYQVPQTWFDNYNTGTGEIFAQIAYRGGGRKIELTDAEQLVPAVMHFSLEESWWPVFDEFYRLYLDTCR